MKLKGKTQDFSGRTLIIPVLGQVEFDKNGILNVDDDAQAQEVIELTKGSIDLIPADAQKSKPVAQKAVQEDQDPGEEEETENGPSAETIALLGGQIEAADTEQLLELAKASGLAPEVIAGMTDRRLKNVLLKQIGLPVKRGNK